MPTRSPRSQRGPYDTLVIVDVQKAFSIPPPLVEKIRRYAARFHCRVFTRFVNPPGSLFRQKLKQHSCYPGTEDTELLLTPEKGDLVFFKAGYGLEKKDLAKLHARGIKRVTVCGLDTDACVLGVMFSLFDAGIECRVKRDLCWSSSGLQREGMKIIEQQFPSPK
jgi:nicotinamidase-related amidase